MTLKDDMLTDLDTMLNKDEFADEGVYSPETYASVHPSSKSTTFNGNFNEAFKSVNDGESYPPEFDCAKANVLDASHGAKLTVKSVVYTIRSVQHDHPELGPDMTRLILEAP